MAKAKPKKKRKKTRALVQKFDKIKQDRYLQMIGRGVGRTLAARAVGVESRSVTREKEASEEFATLFSEAEMEATDAIENAVWASAKKGNVTAQIFWLLNRAKDKWKDLRNVGAQGGVPVITMQHMTKIIHNTFHVKPDGTGDKGVRLKEGVPGLTVKETGGDNGDGSGNGNGT